MFDPSVAPLHLSASVVDTIREPLSAGGRREFCTWRVAKGPGQDGLLFPLRGGEEDTRGMVSMLEA